MSKKDYYDPIIVQYRIPGAQIHVTNNGKNVAVKDGKVVGEDAFFVLPQVTKVGYSPRTQKKLSILGIKNEEDLKRHINKDGSINWNSFEITPWQASQIQSLKDPNWRDKYGMSADLETLNVLTAGMLNRLSLSQNIRAIYDIFDPSTSAQSKIRSIIIGNNGIVPDKFVNEHPFASAIINGAFDAYTINPKNLVGLYKGAKGFAHESYLTNKYYPRLYEGVPVRRMTNQERLGLIQNSDAAINDRLSSLEKLLTGKRGQQVLKKLPEEDFKKIIELDRTKFNGKFTKQLQTLRPDINPKQTIEEITKEAKQTLKEMPEGTAPSEVTQNKVTPTEVNQQSNTPKLSYRLPNGDPVEVSVINKDGNIYGVDLFNNKIRLNPEGTEIAAGPQLGISNGSKYNLQPESWKVTSSGNGNYSIESINKKPSKFYQYAYTRPIKDENVVTKGLLQKGKEKLVGIKTSQNNTHTSLQGTNISYDPSTNMMSIKETNMKASPIRYVSKSRMLGTGVLTPLIATFAPSIFAGKYGYKYWTNPIIKGVKNFFDYSNTNTSNNYDWNGRITLDNGVDVDTIMRNDTIYGILNEPSTIKDSEYVPSKGGNWYPASRVFKDSEGNYRVDPNSLIHVNKGPFRFNLPNETNNQELQNSKPQERNTISPEQQAIDNQYNASESEPQETQQKPKIHNTKHKKKTNSNSLPKMTDPDYEEYERGEILSYIPKQFRNTYYG